MWVIDWLVSLVKSIAFFSKVLYQSQFTDAGPFIKESDYPDLSNQTWIVTGATGGIGLETSKILVKQNAKLWIVGRNPAKIEAAITELKQVKPTARVNFLVMDYTDLSTIKHGFLKFAEANERLHGIIHNAGVMNVPRGTYTAQGHEETIGVNNLATQLLQDLLDPYVVSTPGARIIWLSSIGHLFSPKDGFSLDLLTGKSHDSPVNIYAMTKALDYIQAVQWSLRHPDSGVKSIAVHPGAIKSNLSRHTPWIESIMAPVYYDTPYGALPIVYAAFSPDVQNNEYVIPFGRPGLVRPDVYRAARDKKGKIAVDWIQSQISYLLN